MLSHCVQVRFKRAHLSHNLELMIQSVINNKSNSSTTARQDSSYLGNVLEEAPISITISSIEIHVA